MELVTTYTICSFFKDDPNLVKRGQRAFDSGHVVAMKYAGDGRAIGTILASYEQKAYDVKVCSEAVA